MADEESKQRLAAIINADVVGYSRLLSQDRVGTIKTIKDHRKLFADSIQEYGGRIVDTPGDNILAILDSVSDAVNCAVEIQRELAERNAEVPSARMMQWRIGIELGDIVEGDSDEVYGDGVNTSKRVQDLAEAGGICISGKVHDHVKNKLGLEYESLGEQDVKNISESIPVYRVLLHPGAAAHRVVKAKSKVTRKWQKVTLTICAAALLCVISVLAWDYYFQSSFRETYSAAYEKPTVAVLPFSNLTGNASDESFCDGLTDQIITGLSSLPHLSVIASNSVFTYKGRAVKIQEVAKELAVGHVVEGSVQRSGENIRINAQLIDAASGYHLWAETYDRLSTDLFQAQDEVTRSLITSLQWMLTEGEYARKIAESTENLEALKHFWRAEYDFLKSNYANAQTSAEKAVAIDPEFSGGFAILGYTHLEQGIRNWGASRVNSFRLAEQYARKALSHDNLFPKALMLLGTLEIYNRNYDKAILHFEKAVSASPNCHHMVASLGLGMLKAGRFSEAISYLQKAANISHSPQSYALTGLCTAQYYARQYDKAIAACSQLSDNNSDKHFFSAAIYSEIGKKEKAHFHISELLKLNQTANMKVVENWQHMKNPADYARLQDALISAGLPLGDIQTPGLYMATALHYLDLWYRQQESQALGKALKMAQKRLASDGNAIWGHYVLCLGCLNSKQYEKAIAEAEKAIGIDPEGRWYGLLGHVYNHIGRFEKAIRLAEKSLQHNPENAGALGVKAHAYRLTGRFEGAVAMYQQLLGLNPGYSSLRFHIGLAILYVQSGRIEEAKTHANEVLKLVPHFSVDIWGERNPMKDREQVERDMAALRKAGLK